MLRTIYEIARADFLERVRRFGFALTMVLAVFAAYAFVPPNHVNYATLFFDRYRGIYNSAWVGAQVAVMASAYMILVGFYLVRNGINRDRETGVGQILAGTPMSKTVYAIGKWLSNCAVLAAIVVVLMFGAAALQLIRAEDTALRPLQIIPPFLYLLIPTLAFVSAIAVLFECIPFLRGGLGSIAYFFIIPQTALPEVLGGPRIMGIGYVLDHMQEVVRASFPEYTTGLSVGFNTRIEGVFDLETFVWDGMPITIELLLLRGMWFVVALGIVLIAAIPFERFDTARLQKARRRKPRKQRFRRLCRLFGKSTPEPVGELEPAVAVNSHTTPAHLTPLAKRRPRTRLFALLKANLKLALKAMPYWWHMVSLGVIAAEIFAPRDVVFQFVLPGALIWPILIWSPLGNREVRHATHQIVFSAARPLKRQIPAAWLTGVVVALFLLSGFCVRLFITGDWPRLLALLVGAAFVPSFALALGAWSRSSRLFEVLYLFWWYIGPFNAIAPLDYAGASKDAGSLEATAIYALATLVLLILGFFGARRQLQT
jgi:hypothetical protein